MKYIDLFGGIGGFSYGIKQATKGKWECVYYNDFDKYAVQTYNKNYGENYEATDITTVKTTDIPDHDCICGGFPCQTFSIAGKRKGFEDIRGTMFFEIMRIAKAKRTKYLFLENVKGLLNHNKGKTFTTILQTLEELGYEVQWMVLNSKFFGVPQNRERVFIIGSLRGECRPEILPFSWNDGQTPEGLSKGYSSKTISTRTGSTAKQQTIINHSLYPRSSKTNKGGTGHLTKMDGSTYCLDTGNMQGLETHNTITEAIGRQGSSKEYKSSCKKIYGNTNQIRRLTPTECERLQGFPDGWTEGVSDTQRYKQMGNAVTTNVIEAIVRSWESNKK